MNKNIYNHKNFTNVDDFFFPLKFLKVIFIFRSPIKNFIGYLKVAILFDLKTFPKKNIKTQEAMKIPGIQDVDICFI